MRQKPGTKRSHGAKVVKDIRRATRKQYSAEEKIRIVLDGLKGEESIAELCRREGIAQSLYYSWSKEFLEAGKRRLAGDTARAATSTVPETLSYQITLNCPIGADVRHSVARIRYESELKKTWLDFFETNHPCGIDCNPLPTQRDLVRSWT